MERLHTISNKMKFREVTIGCMICLLCGCSAAGLSPSSEEVEGTYELKAAVSVTSQGSDMVPSDKIQKNPLKKGTFEGTQAERLPSDAEQLIRAYMERYYESLSKLELTSCSDLFTPDAGEQVLMNESALSYLIGLRSMQDTDLRLADYDYAMEVDEVRQLGDGAWEVFLTETSTQNFMEHPEIDSELFRIRHYFLMEQSEGHLRVKEHLQRDGIYRNLLGDYWNWDVRSMAPQPETYYPERVRELLQEAGTGKAEREEENIVSYPEAEFSYDREAAVSYSNQWVGKRNQEWDDFTGRGGNCQNFVSQCLFAGGIPMDDQGDAVWLWHDSGDLSSSWIGVDEFYRYTVENSGFGLVAVPDAPYTEGEEGDLIRMGHDGDWNHVVMISHVIRDAQGNAIDYLINSNTSDVRNFPVSAYPNPIQRLTKIIGRNE